jgi:hypothetical protein
MLSCYALQNSDDNDKVTIDKLAETENHTDNKKRSYSTDELNETDSTIKRVKVETSKEVSSEAVINTTTTATAVKSCPWTDETKQKFTTMQPIRDHFFAAGWRDKLCRCQKVRSYY